MLAVQRDLQTAFGAKAVKNSQLPVLRMIADERLFIQGAGADIGLMVDQCYASQVW